MAMPVMRWNTHDHMPSRPRYSVPRGVLDVVSDTDGVKRVPADTVVLPGRSEVGARAKAHPIAPILFPGGECGRGRAS
ncbi:hypothetical protein GCM10025768_09300 [Microbacterium pseudoresistens]